MGLEFMGNSSQKRAETDATHFGPEVHLLPQQIELREVLPENVLEAQLLALLGATGDPQHVDERCRASNLPVAQVSGALVMIELKGFVALVGPMTYVKAPIKWA
jgi:DNA processing protein